MQALTNLLSNVPRTEGADRPQQGRVLASELAASLTRRSNTQESSFHEVFEVSLPKADEQQSKDEPPQGEPDAALPENEKEESRPEQNSRIAKSAAATDTPPATPETASAGQPGPIEVSNEPVRISDSQVPEHNSPRPVTILPVVADLAPQRPPVTPPLFTAEPTENPRSSPISTTPVPAEPVQGVRSPERAAAGLAPQKPKVTPPPYAAEPMKDPRSYAISAKPVPALPVPGVRPPEQLPFAAGPASQKPKVTPPPYAAEPMKDPKSYAISAKPVPALPVQAVQAPVQTIEPPEQALRQPQHAPAPQEEWLPTQNGIVRQAVQATVAQSVHLRGRNNRLEPKPPDAAKVKNPPRLGSSVVHAATAKTPEGLPNAPNT